LKPILVLDCYLDPAGGAHHFTRRVGARPTEVVRPTREPVPLTPERWSAVLITGSAACLPDGNVPWADGVLALVRAAASVELPVFGVCFGHQAIAAAIAGPDAVRKMRRPEVGFQSITVDDPSDPVVGGLAPRFRVFVSHEDEVVDGSPGLVTLAHSDACASHALRVEGLPIWGVQFHAEMDLVDQRNTLTYRAGKHPQLGLDVEQQLAISATIPEVAQPLFDAFLDVVDRRG
jgi:GMP synthase-like glutamine amidotransferase